MSPTNTPPANQPKAQDVAVPVNPAPAEITQTANIELANDIPVKAQINAANPVQMPVNQPHEESRKNDSDLDSILKDVNKKVGTSDKPVAQPQFQPAGKKSKKAFPDISKFKHFLPIAAACMVAIGLSVAAVYAFNGSQQEASHAGNNPGKVGTTSTASDAIKAAGGSVVSTGEIDNFMQSLQELDKLNDAQEFSQAALNEQTLGL